MKKGFLQDRRWNILFIIAAVAGVVISIIRLKIAAENNDRFRTMLSIFWIIAFIVGGIRSYLAYRKAGQKEHIGTHAG